MTMCVCRVCVPVHYACALLSYRQVSVNITPNGRGDALLSTEGWKVEVDDSDDDRTNLTRGVQEEEEEEEEKGVSVYAENSSSSDDYVPASEVFVMPEERRMTFAAFIDMLGDGTSVVEEEGGGEEEEDKNDDVDVGDGGGNDHDGRSSSSKARRGRGRKRRPIPYVSRQNDSLTEEFPELAGDCDEHLPWATEAFGAPPDAVNLWCGDERAETTFHRDHYENVYCVVSGVKIFHLLPPADGHRLRYRQDGHVRVSPTDITTKHQSFACLWMYDSNDTCTPIINLQYAQALQYVIQVLAFRHVV